MSSFRPDNMPDLAGKVILITGGNAGLGKQTALQLAKHNHSHIFIGSRSKEKAQTAISEIIAVVPKAQLSLVQMDLSSLASVNAAAKEVLAKASRLDILINNAGIMAVPPQVSVNGYEIQFATNHLGHALLTKLLLPLMLNTAQQPGSDVRIINLTSHSHQRAPREGIQFDNLRSAGPPLAGLVRYGQSKLANILHVKQLAQRYPSIKSIAVHPGMANTGLTTTMKKSSLLARYIMPVVAYFKGIKVEDGVLNPLWAVSSTDARSGEYYEPVGVGGLGSLLAEDAKLAEKLWEWTEHELKGFEVHANL